MSKNASNNKSTSKKKSKPYYMKQGSSAKKDNVSNKSPMANNTFVLGVGFLIIIYSRYLSNQVSSVLVNLFGLGIMMYAMYRSLMGDKQAGKKRAVVIDIIIMIIILIAIIYGAYWLAKIL